MQIILDFTDEQWARVAAAVSRVDGLRTEPVLDEEQKVVTPSQPRSATVEEVTARVAGYIEGIVGDQEHAAAREAAAAAVAPLGVSASLQAKKVDSTQTKAETA